MKKILLTLTLTLTLTLILPSKVFALAATTEDIVDALVTTTNALLQFSGNDGKNLNYNKLDSWGAGTTADNGTWTLKDSKSFTNNSGALWTNIIQGSQSRWYINYNSGTSDYFKIGGPVGLYSVSSGIAPGPYAGYQITNSATSGTLATAAAINVVSNEWLTLTMFGGGPGLNNDQPFKLLYAAAIASGKAWNITPSPLHYFFTNSVTITNRGFKIFSFGNGTSVGSTSHDVPMVTLEFLASATNGIVLTEQSQAQQSDSGNIENIGIINNNPLGAAILFASTNGTSDGYRLRDVSVQNPNGRGVYVQWGLSGSRFENVTLENCGIGLEISTGGITQGDIFDIDLEGCNMGMKLTGGNGFVFYINHCASSLTNLATLDNVQAEIHLGHIEWRDTGNAEILMQGAGNSKLDIYGATETGATHACWFIDDQSTTFADLIYLHDLNGLPDTNINGAFPSVRVISSARQIVHSDRFVQEAIFNAGTILRSNTVVSFFPAVYQAADAGAFGMFFPYVDWSLVQPRLLMKYPTNANGSVPTTGTSGYAEPDLLRYDKDFRAGNILARLDQFNVFGAAAAFQFPVTNLAEGRYNAALAIYSQGGQLIDYSGQFFGASFDWFGRAADVYTISDYGFYQKAPLAAAPFTKPVANTSVPFWYFDGQNNRTTVGHMQTNAPIGLGTLNVEGSLNAPTNIAGFGSWNQETITLGQSFTNKSGSRALLHINASHNDAVGSQPMMVISNLTRNVVWTNAVGALAATIPWTQDFPGWSTNDIGIIKDVSTGTATETLVKASWITQ